MGSAADPNGPLTLRAAAPPRMVSLHEHSHPNYLSQGATTLQLSTSYCRRQATIVILGFFKNRSQASHSCERILPARSQP